MSKEHDPSMTAVGFLLELAVVVAAVVALAQWNWGA